MVGWLFIWNFQLHFDGSAWIQLTNSNRPGGKEQRDYKAKFVVMSSGPFLLVRKISIALLLFGANGCKKKRPRRCSLIFATAKNNGWEVQPFEICLSCSREWFLFPDVTTILNQEGSTQIRKQVKLILSLFDWVAIFSGCCSVLCHSHCSPLRPNTWTSHSVRYLAELASW